jgi:hypothetical protein
MPKLSIVVVGRDDGYGDDTLSPYNASTPDTFCFRMKRTIENNLGLFEKKGVDIEYVVVDWSPLGEKTLDKNEYVRVAFENKKVKHVIVPPTSVENRGWNPKNFYEYYAKNVGIRNSESEFVLITNPDIVFTQEIVSSISEALTTDDGKSYYRPYSRIDVSNNLEHLAEGVTFLKNGLFQDEVLGTPAAGDFLLSRKDNFCGYDERHDTSPTKQQTNMDSNILFTMYHQGVKPVELSGSILHLDHGKPHEKEGAINHQPYENVSDWGMREVVVNA